jgi:hypothetical protein
MARAATEKHFLLVQKLWRIVLLCGKLRKTKSELPAPPFQSALDNLHNNKEMLDRK